MSYGNQARDKEKKKDLTSMTSTLAAGWPDRRRQARANVDHGRDDVKFPSLRKIGREKMF
ncbi:hypothetical protein A6R68_18493 [Neotoma lepida]|uniref:Uncharacterized protein n=1 Tax=Neotoma lepida TaxID=56216 RepID=A0A1A6HM90_NEOLE|nr:hypothetical protein A6R68_18493 [Neotoma lepida]